MQISFNLEILKKSELSSDEFLLLMYLEQNHYSNPNIQKTMNITERTISRCVKKLKDKGFVDNPVQGVYIVTDKIADLWN